jgi:hypothetical protein
MFGMPDARAKQAKAQRKHAAKLKKKGIPRSDDLARALLGALRTLCHSEKVQTDLAERIAIPWVARASKQLEARGFERRHAIERFVHTLFPDDVVSGFDRSGIIERIDQARLPEDGKTDDSSAC